MAPRPITAGAALLVGLLLTSASWAQDTFTLVRLVTAREGGPVPIGEATAFEATDPKVVAWAQFAAVSQTHSVVFRWFDPRRRLHRASPVQILAPGEEFLWDELPVRGAPAADLPGTWMVELLVGPRLVTTVRFTIHPRRVIPTAVTAQHQSAVTTKSQQTRTGTGLFTIRHVTSFEHLVQWTRRSGDNGFALSLSAEKLWGTSDGLRGSGVLSLDRGGRFYLQGGAEGSTVTDSLQTPPLRLDTVSGFFDLRYVPPERPSLSLTYRRTTAVDDYAPPLTDSVTSTWTASLNHAAGRVSFSGTYTVAEVDDRAPTNADTTTRTLTLTGVFVASPRLLAFATRTSVTQDFAATPSLWAFNQETTTTTLRLTYRTTPLLSLTLSYIETAFIRSDALFGFSTSQWGAEAAYTLSPSVTARVLTQWQEQSTTFSGSLTRSDQRLTRYSVDASLAGPLTAGLAFSPQLATAGALVTRADLLTAYVNYFPSAAFFLSVSYTQNRTFATGVDLANEVFALSLRYAPTVFIEYQLTAQSNDARFPALPAANVNILNYQFSAVMRY